MRAVAITTVIKMQFTVFCYIITVKLHFRRNVDRSSSVIIRVISEWIYTSIRPRTIRNIMVLANVSHSILYAQYIPLKKPLDFFFFQQEYLCYVKIRYLSLILTLSYSDQYFKSHVVLLIPDCISILGEQ